MRIFFLLTVLIFISASASVYAQTPSIRSSYVPNIAFAQAFIIEEEGFDTAEGFDLQLLAGGTKDQTFVVGLADLATRWPKQLSGGQRQRVAIARALAVEPAILLMDEPFSALDSYTREELQDELLRIWKSIGKTILFVTHDIREARYISDRIITLGGTPVGIMRDETINEQRPRSHGA